MNLLMITRKIDSVDWLAGHGYEWAKAISDRLKGAGGKLAVICLEKGNISGLENVEVFSLGKETGNSRWSRFWRMQKLLAGQVGRCDGIFCHQNPEYAIVAAPWAFVCGKSIVSWYVHKSVTWKTRAMLAVSSKVLTASPESFRIPSPKVEVVGHGIDTRKFIPYNSPRPSLYKREGEERVFRIVTVGRISPVKGLENMISAIKILVDRGVKAVRLDIVGDIGLPEHEPYLKKLKAMVEDSRLEAQVKFLPPVPHNQVVEVYQNSDLFINLSETGSLDKAVLEAMACEVPVLTSNEAFFGLLSPVGDIAILRRKDAGVLAERILTVKDLTAEKRGEIGKKLRNMVVEKHSLDHLAKIITGHFIL